MSEKPYPPQSQNPGPNDQGQQDPDQVNPFAQHQAQVGGAPWPPQEGQPPGTPYPYGQHYGQGPQQVPFDPQIQAPRGVNWQPDGSANRQVGPMQVKAQAKDVPSSISYTIDVLIAALNPNKKRKRLLIAAVIAVIILIGVVVYFSLKSSPVADQIARDGSEAEELELGPPTWEEAPMVDVAVRAEPAGARIAINGWLQDGGTPGTFQLIKGMPNTLTFFAKGYRPHTLYLEANADLSQGVEATLLPVEDVETGKVRILLTNPDDANGATAWLNGIEIGSLPNVVDEVPLGIFQLLTVKRPERAPYVLLFRPMNADTEVTVPRLGEGVYLDRFTEVELKLDDSQARAAVKVAVNDDTYTTPGRLSLDKGNLVIMQVSLPDKETFRYSLHTTPMGSAKIEPFLDWPDLGSAKLALIQPKGRNLLACLRRPGRSLCWNDPKDTLTIPAGNWDVQAFEPDGKRRRWAKGRVAVTIEADIDYQLRLDVNADAEVEAELIDPRTAPKRTR